MAKTKAVRPKAAPKGKAKAALVSTKVIDKLEDAKVRRSRDDEAQRSRTEAQAVKKIEYDHFKDFTEEELFLREVAGCTLHERLVSDRKKWLKKEIPMGPTYYSARRAEYRNPESAMARLNPDNPADEKDETLSGILLSLIENKSNVQLFIDWADCCDSINNYNVIAIYRQCLQLPPAGCLEHTIFGTQVMTLVETLSLHTRFPQPFAVMRDYFDVVLQSSLANAKAEGKSPSFWWRTLDSMGGLILPTAAMDKVMGHEGEWKEIKDDVEEIFNSSKVGQVLMEKSMRQISLERLDTQIQEIAEKVAQLKVEITTKVLTDHRVDFVKVLKSQGIDANKAYEKVKDLELYYRGAVYSASVTSPIDQFNMLVHSYIRGAGVDQGLLDPVWCENDLIGARPKSGITLSADVIKLCSKVREAMNESLTYEESTAPVIKDTVKKKAAWFQSLENKGRVEISFWRSSIGDEAKSRVQQAVLRCFVADSPKALTLSDSLHKFQALKDSKLAVFAGVGCSHTIKLVEGFVKSMKAGLPPPSWTQLARASL